MPHLPARRKERVRPRPRGYACIAARYAQIPPRLPAPLWMPLPNPYAIIQFGGSIARVARAALEQTGVAILECLPDFAYLVRGDADQLAAADKLAPALLNALARGQMFDGPLRVVGWPDDDRALDPRIYLRAQ